MNIENLKFKTNLKTKLLEACEEFKHLYKRYPTISELYECFGVAVQNDSQITESVINEISNTLTEQRAGRERTGKGRERTGGSARERSPEERKQAAAEELPKAPETVELEPKTENIFDYLSRTQSQKMMSPEASRQIRLETGRLTPEEISSLSPDDMSRYSSARLNALKSGKIKPEELTAHDVELMTTEMQQELNRRTGSSRNLPAKTNEIIIAPKAENERKTSLQTKDIVKAETLVATKPVSAPTNVTTKDITVAEKDRSDKDKDKGEKDRGDKDKGEKDKRRRFIPFGLGDTPPELETTRISPPPAVKMADETAAMETLGAKARRSFINPMTGGWYTSETPVMASLNEGKLTPRESAQRKVKKQKYKVVYIQDGKKIEVFASSVRGVRRVVYGKKSFRVYNASGSDLTGYFRKMLSEK